MSTPQTPQPRAQPVATPPDPEAYLPPADALYRGLRISKARLDSRTRVVINTALLKLLLKRIVASLPFDPAFYLARNPDLAQAHARGEIADLHQHYVETGFFEGRVGASPPLDEAFYLSTYEDVRAAIEQKLVPSAVEHYLSTGAAEGRAPNADMQDIIAMWHAVLRDTDRY